ncbi:MAG: hypothetical protein L0154_13480 [Chloroflexi bacterium]|nr:hypothetical protein [Chloroflexota bacterium]
MSILGLVIFTQFGRSSETLDTNNCENWECWHGIYPGTTRSDMAQKLLEASYGKENVKQDRTEITWTSSNKNDRYMAGSLYVSESGIVLDITIYTQQLSLSEFIEDVGPPTTVYVGSFPLCGLAVLFFRNSNMSVYDFGNRGPKTYIEQDQEIYSVTMLTPEQSARFGIDDTIPIAWQGFANYCDLASSEATEMFTN